VRERGGVLCPELEPAPAIKIVGGGNEASSSRGCTHARKGEGGRDGGRAGVRAGGREEGREGEEGHR